MHPRREDRCPEEQLWLEAHDGVMSRAELRGRGWDRDAIARQVRARRWALHGAQTVSLHRAALGRDAHLWRACWEVGPRVAALDGVTALQVAGLTGYRDETIHVSVPHTAAVVAPPGVRVHKVVRRVPGELVGGQRLRTVPAVAAVRAAHWAVSDRQAALTLVMPVQQRLLTGPQLLQAVRAIRGRNRRRLIRTLATDIADGAQSLGELDFARLCRRRGLPEPTRQAVRVRSGGRVYLDAAWDDIGLAVEIDGSHHQWGAAATDDHFRQNALVLGGEHVLRMTLMGLRLSPDRFMDQVCEAHRVLSRRMSA